MHERMKGGRKGERKKKERKKERKKKRKKERKKGVPLASSFHGDINCDDVHLYMDVGLHVHNLVQNCYNKSYPPCRCQCLVAHCDQWSG